MSSSLQPYIMQPATLSLQVHPDTPMSFFDEVGEGEAKVSK